LFSRDGHTLSDDEISGLLIGLLLAGQHTSSTTSAWMTFFLARDKELQERCYAEQKAVCGEDLPPLEFDQVAPNPPGPSPLNWCRVQSAPDFCKVILFMLPCIKLYHG
jgi:cytochrome P450